MANIIQTLVARIEEYRASNKNPCKNYGSEDAANKAAEKIADGAQKYFGTKEPARYVVFFNEAWGRWNIAFDMTEYMRRSDFGGGYIGYFSAANIYTY